MKQFAINNLRVWNTGGTTGAFHLVITAVTRTMSTIITSITNMCNTCLHIAINVLSSRITRNIFIYNKGVSQDSVNV